ncbi:DUF6779 domain-containing protein [Jongsikchunia kroppenstedtii]|uniref:DUF6779 domain-containing protein n=1 Tax=Jongsikchunia kroppenstedtii TaxID=1121721 RepID=UPI0004770188|nr:DUF6779 domain-containing protein [Jongsikchunia kroppenstedtii]
MTTSTGRGADTRRRSRSAGQWLIGALLVLAVAASILMIFTAKNMPIAAALAVVAALWAGVIAAILVTRYRRQADAAEAKSRDLRLVYELQLEREITARRQYEMGVEAQVRKEVVGNANEELAALKAELRSLRSAVEVLVGGELPEEQTALGREKLRELGHGVEAVDHRAVFDGAVAEQDFASTPRPDAGGQHSAEHGASAQTATFPVVEPDIAVAEHDSSEDEANAAGIIDTETVFETQNPRPEPTGNVVEAESVEPAAAGRHGKPLSRRGGLVDDTPTDEWESISRPNGIPADLLDDEPAAAVPEPEYAASSAGSHARHGAPAAPASTDAAAPEAEEPTGGRRGAHTGGRSVSELLNGAQSMVSGGGRRRRRD